MGARTAPISPLNWMEHGPAWWFMTRGALPPGVSPLAHGALGSCAIGLEYLCLSTGAQTDRLTDRRTVANARRDAEEEQKELLHNHSQSVNDVFYVDK